MFFMHQPSPVTDNRHRLRQKMELSETAKAGQGGVMMPEKNPTLQFVGAIDEGRKEGSGEGR